MRLRGLQNTSAYTGLTFFVIRVKMAGAWQDEARCISERDVTYSAVLNEEVMVVIMTGARRASMLKGDRPWRDLALRREQLQVVGPHDNTREEHHPGENGQDPPKCLLDGPRQVSVGLLLSASISVPR